MSDTKRYPTRMHGAEELGGGRMILIGDYHLSLITAMLGFANALLLLVLIFRKDRHDD